VAVAMRRGAVIALSTLVAVLIASCGGGGDEGTGGEGARGNDPFYGVISAEPLPGPAELARLGDGGVGTLRINLAWGSVQSGPDAPYDWSHYDPVVLRAAKSGVRVLATVYSTPSWAASTAEIPPLDSDLSGFEDFARAAARRYGAAGTFWADHPDVPKLPISDWQLWNEPNSPLFWKPSPNAGQYLSLLRGFSSAVKGVDPAARILLGGLFPTPTGGISLDDFLSALYEGGGRRLFDAVALHPYARTPRIALDRVEQARGVMRRFGDADKPIWITEVGWASRGTPPGLVVGPAGQADYLRQTFELALADRDRLGIAGVVWYSLNDTPGPLWVGHCGLFTLDGVAKPSWKALVELTGGSLQA
jgi:polysaccharide biosynthesis protein PslG